MTTNTVLLTYWQVSPQVDLTELHEIRELHAAKVFEPVFKTGDRRFLGMEARFDADDPEACMAAALHVVRNAKTHASADGATITGIEVFLNGRKMTHEKIPA